MMIKQRLFISNILMIVIPVVLSLVITSVGMVIAWTIYFPESERNIASKKISRETRIHLVEMTKELLEERGERQQQEKTAQITRFLKKSDMSLEVMVASEKLYSLGTSAVQYHDRLLEAVAVLGGQGTVRLGNEELYAEKVINNGQTYGVYIYGTAEFNDDKPEHVKIVNIMLLIGLGVLTVVFFTSRFLARFVFQRIEQPLDILADGVHQIRDGNLDYQINYQGKDEFTPVCEDFNDMAKRLKESVSFSHKQELNRKELLAGISHDLRSPLTSIKAYAEGLLDGVAKTPEAQQTYAQMIRTKAGDIDQMVAKLFLFSKMDLGNYPYYPETINLEEEILSLVNATAEEYGSKGLEVKVEHLDKGVDIYVDPVLLRSVFANILENSLKYKDKERTCVAIRTEKRDHEVSIYIEDNGPGVPKEALPKLFNVFYRSDPSRHNPNKGSGLGLAITAKAIHRMGGTINAENAEPKGLRMVIKLPIHSKENANEKDTNY